jgi:hypothetical protein
MVVDSSTEDFVLLARLRLFVDLDVVLLPGLLLSNQGICSLSAKEDADELVACWAIRIVSEDEIDSSLCHIKQSG